MASEKRTSVNFSVIKDGFTSQLVLSLNEDLSGDNFLGGVQNVGTSWEAIGIEDLASVDLMALKNTDATNYVEIAIANDGSGIFTKLLPGRGCFLPGATGATYYAKFNTGAGTLKKCICEP